LAKPVIKVENLSKQYRLGQVGTGTISHDVNRWWYKIRGKEDPYLKIGESNDRTVKGDSDYVWALKDINFEVEQGEVLGIIGRNGAGKSTLLKILSRTTSPTTGSVKLKGRVASLLEVGTGFHPELSGRDNIYLNGAILGMTRHEIKRKFDEIVDFAGVERYIDTPVKRYSSGMYVRLAFGVAAHLESEILIVDEVLAVGDAEFQKKCLGKMKEVSEGQGRTVLFVSHNMTSIRNLCPRAFLLANGGIVKMGGIDDVLSHYLNIDDLSEGYRKDFFGIQSTGLLDIEFVDPSGQSIESFDYIDYCWVRFKIAVVPNKSTPNLGFTLFNNRSEAVISSVNTDTSLVYEFGEYYINAKIPCGLLVLGRYYLEFAYNGFNLESAVIISKNSSSSKFISSGNISKSNLVTTEWTISL
jgi:lipopolysaccharide transport system ATP-binding protein